MAIKKFTLDEEEQNGILSGLSNGLGFTRACEILILDPKDVSKYVLSNKQFNISCIESLKIRSKALLVESNQYLNKRKFKSWKNNGLAIQKLNTDLVLWESHCINIELSTKIVIQVLLKYNDVSDAATSIGMYTPELKEYINNNNNLYIYCSNNNLV